MALMGAKAKWLKSIQHSRFQVRRRSGIRFLSRAPGSLYFALSEAGRLGSLEGMLRDDFKLRVVVFLVAVAWLLPGAQARLGETSAQCEARYGEGKDGELKVVKDMQGAGEKWRAMVYSTRGLSIAVVFENDRAVFIRYANEPFFKLQEGALPGLDLTQEEIAYLKEANGGKGRSWIVNRDPLVTKSAPMFTVWTSSDGEVFAGYNREHKELFVSTKEFYGLVMKVLGGRYGGGGPGDAAARLDGL
jgi:hypothetical protein